MCRGCYASTLSRDELDRLNAEPITMPVYLCPEHEVTLPFEIPYIRRDQG